MGLNLTQKILREHLVEGEMKPGQEIGIRIDHTLLTDTLGIFSLLYFETMGIPRVRCKLSVCYVDHSMLQLNAEQSDDHLFLQSASAKYGVLFSKPGNGICHQVHLERFGEPGATMLGSDSHTPTAGAGGMLAMGAGSLDVAVAMGGGTYYLRMPSVVRVHLKGRISPWVSGKDLILALLQRLSVKGGVGRVFEYTGEGALSLSVPQRGTICNMGTELGATSSLFPSDEAVRQFMKAQGREQLWRPLAADADAVYDEKAEIDLGELEPMAARPGSPDVAVPVREVEGVPVRQVCVGSCTNSSYADLEAVAGILKDKRVHPEVSLTVTPGSRLVLQMISRTGALGDMIEAGARILESTCGPCLGNGQVPPSGVVSLRTFNRNFPGRSGAKGDNVYLVSPEVAAASALSGQITDPRRLGTPLALELPDEYPADDSMILMPAADPESVKLHLGPGMRPLPRASVPSETIRTRVLLKTGDNISTDDITPVGAKVLAPRHNIPWLSEYCFQRVDETFAKRALEAGEGIIVGGINYGQGSSREFAALVPMYLGIRTVIARSFARIHWNNLVNVGILPLTFAEESGYGLIEQGDELELTGVREAVSSGTKLVVRNLTRGVQIPVTHSLTPRQVQIYLDGGLLNYVVKKD